MSQESILMIRKRLDATVPSITEMIKNDIYTNVIVSTVLDWFEGSDSILTLNNNIRKNVENRWPFLESKVNAQLIEFEEYTKSVLVNSVKLKGQELDVKTVSEAVSEGISVIIGSLGIAFVGMISGGSGAALIASGPIGWIIGAIAGSIAYFYGKTRIEDEISKRIIDRKIPALIKKSAKRKVSAQLKLNELRFEQDIHTMLQDILKPIYEVIDHELSK